MAKLISGVKKPAICLRPSRLIGRVEGVSAPSPASAFAAAGRGTGAATGAGAAAVGVAWGYHPPGALFGAGAVTVVESAAALADLFARPLDERTPVAEHLGD